MTPTLIPFSDTGFGRHGLPDDYASLTPEGQRKARVNACRQWAHSLLETNGALRADYFVRALHFFDTYYLTPEITLEGDELFNPGFYDIWTPSPPLHDLFARAMIMHKRSAAVGPRGFAKTYSVAKECLLPLAAVPNFQISYATSTEALTEIFGERCKLQLETNQRLIDDFAPEYGQKGRLRMARGSASWGMTSFKLANLSGLFCTSAESRQRGLRPRVYYLDDPEYDPKQSTSMEVIRQNAETLIFRVVLPMVQKAGSRVSWRGTFVSKQHYLWHALQDHTDPEDLKRFGKWYRVIIPLILSSPGKPDRSAWPHVFPIDEAEKLRLKLNPETETIPEMREAMGDPVFNAEYLANPGDSGTAYFGPLTDAEHGYTIEVVDDLAPWCSNSLLRFTSKNSVIQAPLARLLSLGYRIYITVDSALTDAGTSDFKAATCNCIAPSGELLVLDALVTKQPAPIFADEILKMAARWHAIAIYVENKGGGVTVTESLQGRIRDVVAKLVTDYNWVPAVIPYPPGTQEKGNRIAGNLYLRFHHSLIKLPLYLSHRPVWRMLFDQIRGFNPYARNCGLKNDDLIDCVSAGASPRILKSIPSTPGVDAAPPSPLSRIKAGEVTNPKTGLPHLLSCFHEMTPSDIREALTALAPTVIDHSKQDTIEL